MTRSIPLLAALICAGCITQTEVPPAPEPAVGGDMTVPEPDAGPPVVDADVPEVPDAGDQGAQPIIDMGEEIRDHGWDAAPPEPEPGPRWRPDGVLDDERAHIPLDIVCVDAADYVPVEVIDGRGWAYEWRLVEQPSVSRSVAVERFLDIWRPQESAVPDDTATPQACVFLSAAGAYRLELHMHDTFAEETVLTAQVRVRSEPAEAIHIELTWDTPGDADQTDGDGTDVDLHFIHPDSRNWAQAPLDCYYANASPDWGPAGPGGDPSLDIDDVNGSGPEHINLDSPEETDADGRMYRVGVDYYRADNFADEDGWGPSTATIRIFLHGELAYEAQREMLATHHFWTVAAIEWIDGVGRVVEIDRYHDQVP